METKFKLAMYATIVAFCLETQTATAQLQVNNNGLGDIWGQTNPTSNVQSIGIGDFNGNSVVPQAALHINTNSGFLPTSPTFNAGEVFRTDAPNAATFWKMYRGGNEYGRIYNNNDNHFYIQATNGSGDLRFNTGGANTRMTIASGGNVGIGTTAPVSVLHLNRNTNVSVTTLYTNPNTLNMNPTDGFSVGVNAAGDGIIQHTSNGKWIAISTCLLTKSLVGSVMFRSYRANACISTVCY